MSVEQILDYMYKDMRGNSKRINNAYAFKGGCERWLQMQLALRLVDAGYRINADIFLEVQYARPMRGAADMVVKSDTKQSPPFLIEIKIPSRLATAKIESIINDLYKVWEQPHVVIDGKTVTPEYGAFLLILNNQVYDPKRVLDQIVNSFNRQGGVPKGAIRDRIKRKAIDNQFVTFAFLKHYSF